MAQRNRPAKSSSSISPTVADEAPAEDTNLLTFKLTKERMQTILSLADRGCAAVVGALIQQPDQIGEVARISTIAADAISAAQAQLPTE